MLPENRAVLDIALTPRVYAEGERIPPKLIPTEDVADRLAGILEE